MMKTLSLGAAGLALGLMGATANAQTETFSASVPTTTTNFSSSVSIPKFDSTLGTLLGIQFTLSGTVNTIAKAESLDAAPATITLAGQATITLERPDTSTIAVVLPTTTDTFNASAFDGVIDFGGTSGITEPSRTNSASASASSPPPASDLTLFTGTGSILLPVLAAGTSSGTGAGNLITQFNTTASALVTVTYTYRTSSVPEPGTVAMLAGMGISGSAFLIRRKRRA